MRRRRANVLYTWLEVIGTTQHTPALHPRTSPSQVSHPYSFAFLPNDRGVFAPSLVVTLVIPGRRSERRHSLSFSPPRWSTICHQAAGFPIFRPISRQRQWYPPSKRSPLPPSASPFRIDARRKNEDGGTIIGDAGWASRSRRERSIRAVFAQCSNSRET